MKLPELERFIDCHKADHNKNSNSTFHLSAMVYASTPNLDQLEIHMPRKGPMGSMPRPSQVNLQGVEVQIAPPPFLHHTKYITIAITDIFLSLHYRPKIFTFHFFYVCERIIFLTYFSSARISTVKFEKLIFCITELSKLKMCKPPLGISKQTDCNNLLTAFLVSFSTIDCKAVQDQFRSISLVHKHFVVSQLLDNLLWRLYSHNYCIIDCHNRECEKQKQKQKSFDLISHS